MSYSDNQAIELLNLGLISLCVTLTNVLCIYGISCIVLKVKEVAPVSDEQRQFWKHDIKIARAYNKTVNADEGKTLAEELAQFHENDFHHSLMLSIEVDFGEIFKICSFP